jgi:hypothetical protein
MNIEVVMLYDTSLAPQRPHRFTPSAAPAGVAITCGTFGS